MPKISFESGTLVLSEFTKEQLSKLSCDNLTYDTRSLSWRLPAKDYRKLVEACLVNGFSLDDRARAYQKRDWIQKKSITPRVHQAEALSAWKANRAQGVVCLPTGAGKTILAVLAISDIKRPSLIIVPTIDLLHQWREVLGEFFDVKIGGYGGGLKQLEDLTVATYDSAALIIEHYGDRFGFLVFDECHHLPATQYQLIAKASLAPFRLGLSATVERSDGKETLIYELLGELVYEGMISEMISDVLAPYDVVRIEVALTSQEREHYDKARHIYTSFIRSERINMSSPAGWQEFIRRSSASPKGRLAMKAYQEQKRLAQASSSKIDELWQIFSRHKQERVIVFTNDNSLAYEIGREFFLPVLTHHTRAKERKRMLEAFRQGELDILVTSKVLNEGVDVPEASVAIVVSGSGAVREHVQRLGRVLRHQKQKRATLYELVAKDTNEYYVNQRRRMHHAYQGPSKVYRPSR